MPATVADILRVMEDIAPLSLAESWDNAGLQTGRRDWPVRKIWVALDPVWEVVEAACRNEVDLLITHHPLIMRPLKSIVFDTPQGLIIRAAARNRLAVFSAHTNLDIAPEGVNDVLAERIGLTALRVLKKTGDARMCKFVVFVPVQSEQAVLGALFNTSAGRIGQYTCCSFRGSGKGTFLPADSARPFIGTPGEISQADEIRIETVVREDDLASVVDQVRKQHPYETMAYDVYPLMPPNAADARGPGLGRVGEIGKPVRLVEFAETIKAKLNLGHVKFAGNPDLTVEKAAVCSGSGSGLLHEFLSTDAQVYISGDLKYHDAREVEAAGRGLIDIGHFESEHLVVEALANRLESVLSKRLPEVRVEACRLEKDPFILL